MERMMSLILLLVRLVFMQYEFLVVFGQVQVCDRKNAGRVWVGRACVAGQVWVESVQGGSR